MTKKLSQEFSRTESRILGALSKLDELLLNPQIRTFSGTTSRTFRNTDVENQEPSGDRSQNDPHPEVEFSACRASNLTESDPEETSHTYSREKRFEILFCSLWRRMTKSTETLTSFNINAILFPVTEKQIWPIN